MSLTRAAWSQLVGRALAELTVARSSGSRATAALLRRLESVPGGAAAVAAFLAIALATAPAPVNAQVPQPTVESVAPNVGSSDGGTLVVITGTGFEPGAVVAFGGIPATGVTVDSATQITATTPASIAGPVSVTVTNPDSQNGTLPNAFVFTLRVSTVSPNSGSTLGGTAVTITGSGFDSGAAVAFDGISATDIVVVSSTDIMATTPAHAAGAVMVSVTNPNSQNGSLAGGFTYVAAPPTVDAVVPNSGSSLGGTAVSITGTGFEAGAAVTFDAEPATSVVVVSANQITATTPAHPPGGATVTVTNPDTQADGLPSGYTYLAAPAPSVTTTTPNTGSSLGGTVVSITGTGFAPGATVSFGGAAGTGVVVVSPTEITATTPPNLADVVAVSVTNPDDQTGTLAGAFVYVGATPTVNAVTPALSSSLGGTVVSIRGGGFEAGATVTFGVAGATSVTVVSSGEITATTPPGTVGPALVTVTNPSGQAGTVSDAFAYLGLPPTVTAVTPADGPGLGGTTVSVSGGGFEAGATVSFGGVAATEVVVVSATEITARTPAHGAGLVAVIVTNTMSEGGTLPSAFTYTAGPPPVVTSISPASGPTAGGTTVTVTGTGFAPGASVFLGGVAAPQVTFVSATTVTAVTPAQAAAGLVTFAVANPDGQTASLAAGFTYIPSPAPTVTAVSPSTGPTVGGTPVTITGSGFLAGATVKFGAVLASGVTVVSSNQITATSPPGTAGIVTIEVANADSQNGTLAQAFTYVTSVAPTVTSVAPLTGPAAGGTAVTIAGSGFLTGASVTFGGISATDIVVVSSSQITAKTPAHGVDPV